MLIKDNEKAFISFICSDIRPQYIIEAITEPLLMGYATYKFKFDGRISNTRENVLRYLDSMELSQ